MSIQIYKKKKKLNHTLKFNDLVEFKTAQVVYKAKK